MLKIYTYPEPVLLKKAKPVKNLTSDDFRLVRAMIETMFFAQGVGLAAPQVGVSKRVIVLTANSKILDELKPETVKILNDKFLIDGQAFAIINPEIKNKKRVCAQEEGCLSLPGVSAMVKRYKSITLEAININGEKACIAACDLFARILQHEIDHLNGVLLLQRVGIFKRKKLLKTLNVKPKT